MPSVVRVSVTLVFVLGVTAPEVLRLAGVVVLGVGFLVVLGLLIVENPR